MRKRCFILVGHSHWGKSETLSALTNFLPRRRHIVIPSINPDLTAYVRRASNDDNEAALLRFSSTIALRVRQDYLVITFCPKLKAKRACQTILTNLREQYDLYFFVLMEDYWQEREITEEELSFMNEFATDLRRFYGHHEREVRAEHFATYVRNNLSSTR